MRVKFEMRSQKKGDSVTAPLYVRVMEGRPLNQAVKTRIAVNPLIWDNKLETIKSRAVCKPEERSKVLNETMSLKVYLMEKFIEDSAKESFQVKGWLQRTVDKYYSQKKIRKPVSKQSVAKESFDDLFDMFLAGRELSLQRVKHYEVLRRILHRFAVYVKYSQGRKRISTDVSKVDASVLENLYDYMENEYRYVEQFPEILEKYPETRKVMQRGENAITSLYKELRAFFNWLYKNGKIVANPFSEFKMPSEQYGTPIFLTLKDLDKIYRTDFSDSPSLERQRDIFVFHCNIGCRVGDLQRLTKRDVINGAVEYIPTKTIKETAKTVVVPLNETAQAIVAKYSDTPGESLLPFISTQKYNDAIKEILTRAEINYLVTELDPLTRQEKKVPINEIASSHMARRTFIGNIYKLVKDPNLVSSLTGHVEGSRAFNRYRDIDIDMKKDLVKILDNRA